MVRLFMLDISRPPRRFRQVGVSRLLVAPIRVSHLFLRLGKFDPFFGKGTAVVLVESAEGIPVKRKDLIGVPDSERCSVLHRS